MSVSDADSWTNVIDGRHRADRHASRQVAEDGHTTQSVFSPTLPFPTLRRHRLIHSPSLLSLYSILLNLVSRRHRSLVACHYDNATAAYLHLIIVPRLVAIQHANDKLAQHYFTLFTYLATWRYILFIYLAT